MGTRVRTDVLEAIERIQRHQNPGREVFDTDELVQVWMVRHLQIIGEAVSHMPWRSIIGMRHILVHGYSRSTSIWSGSLSRTNSTS